jgi:antitoxin component of MazEF toxin-antitoxin module
MQENQTEEFRIFDANVSSSGKSLIVTIPKSTCQILSLGEGDFVQIKVKAVKVKPRK